MSDHGTNTGSEIKRFSGAGVLISRNLMKRVPPEDILDAIRLHDEAAVLKSDLPTTPHFETAHTGSNGAEFRVASNQSELLVSAFLPDESSGLHK